MGIESRIPHQEEANDNGKDVELHEEIKEAFDMLAVPDGDIEGDLGELDRDIQAREIILAREAIEKAAALDEPVDFDMTRAPRGPIRNKKLAALDRMLDEDARAAARKKKRNDAGDGEMKKAA